MEKQNKDVISGKSLVSVIYEGDICRVTCNPLSEDSFIHSSTTCTTAERRMCKPSKWDGTGLGATPSFCHTDLYLRLEILVSESWSYFIASSDCNIFLYPKCAQKRCEIVRVSIWSRGSCPQAQKDRGVQNTEAKWLFITIPHESYMLNRPHVCIHTYILYICICLHILSCFISYIQHVCIPIYFTYSLLFYSSKKNITFFQWSWK